MAFATPLFREYGYTDEDQVEYYSRKINRPLISRQRKISESAPDLHDKNSTNNETMKKKEKKLIKQDSTDSNTSSDQQNDNRKTVRSNTIVGLIRRISSKELVPRSMSSATASKNKNDNGEENEEKSF